ncbi:hypothetical protein ACHAXS_003036 [Conticribra weissflogii]
MKSKSIVTNATAFILLLFVSSALPVESDAFSLSRRGTLEFKAKSPASVRTPFQASKIRSDVHYAASNQSEGQVAVRGGDTSSSSIVEKTKAFVEKNFFLVGMVVAVSLAKLYPELGKNGSVLRPELFIGKYGVTSIFLLSGLSLKLAELTNAFANMKLNGMIQAMTFGAWPFLAGLPLTKGIEAFAPNLLPKSLLDGLLIMTCLPTTINMCIILTSASGGNVASALCNTCISNIAGIFITPALLLQFFGKSIELPFVQLVSKLCNKVLLPVAIGQTLRATPIKDFYTNNSKFFKRLQEIILLGIVWNAFCNAFTRGLGLDLRHGIALLTLLPLMHIASLASLFSIFKWTPFKFSRRDAVAATFCSAQKTLAFGLPLIQTIFEGNPNLAAYCSPIMFMHPLQLIIGSLTVPYFSKFTEEENNE